MALCGAALVPSQAASFAVLTATGGVGSLWVMFQAELGVFFTASA